MYLSNIYHTFDSIHHRICFEQAAFLWRGIAGGCDDIRHIGGLGGFPHLDIKVYIAFSFPHEDVFWCVLGKLVLE